MELDRKNLSFDENVNGKLFHFESVKFTKKEKKCGWVGRRMVEGEENMNS